MMLKTTIAGGRNFSNYKNLKLYCDYILQNKHPYIEIVSGNARGDDLLGEQYAKEKGYNVVKFPANWDELGRRAGCLRNVEEFVENVSMNLNSLP